MPERIEAGDVVIAAPGWGSICTFSARLIARTPSSRAAPASAITILQPLQENREPLLRQQDAATPRYF
jgi:hypothetical protein